MTPRVHLIYDSIQFVMGNKKIYGLGVGISMVFKISKDFDMEGQGWTNRHQSTWLIMRNRNVYGLGVGISSFQDIKGF